MTFLFDTVEDFTEEIEFVRLQLRSAVTRGKKFRINTSQTDQLVETDLKGVREYLSILTTERCALAQRNAGQGVTSVVPRRTYS